MANNYFKVGTGVFLFADNDPQDTRLAWNSVCTCADPDTVIATWRPVALPGPWNHNPAYVGHRTIIEIVADIDETGNRIDLLQVGGADLAFLTQPLQDLENRRAELEAHPLYHGATAG